MRSAPYVLSIVLHLVASSATAQTVERSDVERQRAALIDRAYDASRTNNHAEAIRLGEEALRIQATASLRRFVAEEHMHFVDAPEGEAHIIAAVSLASACLIEANERTNMPHRVEQLTRCGAIVDRLAPVTARVRIMAPRPIPPGFQVLVNDVPIAADALEAPVFVIPGTVVVVATARGESPIRQQVTLAAGQQALIQPIFPTRPVTLTASSSVAPRVVGWSLLALGVASGAVGIYQAVRSNTMSDDALHGNGTEGAAWARYYNELNPQRSLTVDAVCDRAASDATTNPDAALASSLCSANATARTFAWAFGIGGALSAVAGAVVLITTTGRAEQPRPVTMWRPTLQLGFRSASIRMEF